MDDTDRRILEMRSQQALETTSARSSVERLNPDNGHYGCVTPTKT